jgi:hypothetical protein
MCPNLSVANCANIESLSFPNDHLLCVHYTVGFLNVLANCIPKPYFTIDGMIGKFSDFDIASYHNFMFHALMHFPHVEQKVHHRLAMFYVHVQMWEKLEHEEEPTWLRECVLTPSH